MYWHSVMKKMAWKSYHEKLSNTQFAWDKNSLSQADTVNRKGSQSAR